MSTPNRPYHRPDANPRAVERAENTNHDDNALLYTPAEAAQLLRVRESWLRKKATARTIPSTFLGKHLRFSPADLVAMVAAAARPATGRRARRRSTTTLRDRDLPSLPQRSVHPPDRDDHVHDGSSPWPG
jgi:excisionase family DNA binding protein